jgi:hypothetical protein
MKPSAVSCATQAASVVRLLNNTAARVFSRLQSASFALPDGFQPPAKKRLTFLMLGLASSLIISACGATAVQVLPTAVPTATETSTPSASNTPGTDATPTASPTLPPMTSTGGPSPTPLFGPTSTGQAAVASTATRSPNPNAPRIEFFTTNVLSVAPGDQITLYWSTRATSGATIYRLDKTGARSQLWNVPADGKLSVPTRRSDRVQIQFILSVGTGTDLTEQTLTVPLSCPDAWFFQPGPTDCPEAKEQQTDLVQQSFERGRMIYVKGTNRIYALFNDGFKPAWVLFDNKFDPAKDPESEPSFVPPPPLLQPLRELGFVWRGNDQVRSRLGLATEPEKGYEGFIHAAALADGEESLYVSSTDGSVLQLVPGGDSWQIITPPSSQ